MNIQLGDVSHIIQLAIAPSFLLAGVGTNLMVLTNRLARIIDRSRALEDRLPATSPVDQSPYEIELVFLYRRMHLINRAITLSTSSGLFVCLVIATLFVGDAFQFDLSKFIASLFVLAMTALIFSFSFFLREIFVTTDSLTPHRFPSIQK